MSEIIPLSLYVHFPWCIKKCPYCDFNSHALRGEIPEQKYLQALLTNLDQWESEISQRQINSIFLGGGTPSLFSHQSIRYLLNAFSEKLNLSDNIEITLEANPGTIDQINFKGYFEAGVNRLSLGIQSFNNDHLKVLGRIHDAQDAQKAIDVIQNAGFSNFNIDLMYGLPQQTLEQAETDILKALSFQPSHVSWYQLTLEPNTFFYKHPPKLPQNDALYEMELMGLSLLAQNKLNRYEVSAFSKERPSQHNLNYWQFGDYLALGAGAHGKLTNPDTQKIIRYENIKAPKQYMNSEGKFIKTLEVVPENNISFEFMLNALRLIQGFEISLFEQRTFQNISKILPEIQLAQAQNLLAKNSNSLQATPRGLNFLNDLLLLFMPKSYS